MTDISDVCETCDAPYVRDTSLDDAFWPGPISKMEIYEIISANLFRSNISDANERMEAAHFIADLLDRRLKGEKRVLDNGDMVTAILEYPDGKRGHMTTSGGREGLEESLDLMRRAGRMFTVDEINGVVHVFFA